MNYTISLQEEAVIEMHEVIEWYNETKNGLGDELKEEVFHCFSKLEQNPQHYTFINTNYRRIKVNRFPYLLIYEIEGNQIIINSFFHTSRKSKYKDE